MTAQLKLSPDTNLIPWPAFLGRVVRQRPEYAALLVLLVGAAVYGAYLALPLLGGLAVLVLFAGSGGGAALVAFAANLQLTRPVVVYRPDSGGVAFEDHQRWWVSDALAWPDVYKREYLGKRVLWLDAMGGDVIPFDPWIAPPPSAAVDGKITIPVTGTRVASVRAKMTSVAALIKYRPKSAGEQIQQGLMIAGIVGGLLAILLAGNRAAEIMGFGP